MVPCKASICVLCFRVLVDRTKSCIPLVNLSIYLPSGSKPTIDFSRLILFTVVLSAPLPPILSSCPGLGSAQVPFLVPVARFRGVREAEITIQISALVGVRTWDRAV